MTPITLPKILIGAALALGLAGAIAFGVSHFAGKAESKAEIQSHEAKAEATAHATTASAIPDHAQELAEAQASVDRARAEVERLRRELATKPILPIPSPDGASQSIAPVVAPDDRDQTIAALGELVAAQDKQIGSLKLALTDKTRQSEEYRLAYEAESRRAAGLEIALAAQKHVSASGKWLGRIQGFAIGIGTGYAAGRLH